MCTQSISLCKVWKFHSDTQRSRSNAGYEHLLRRVNPLSSHQEMANQLVGSSPLTWMDHDVNSYFQSKVLSQAFFITTNLKKNHKTKQKNTKNQTKTVKHHLQSMTNGDTSSNVTRLLLKKQYRGKIHLRYTLRIGPRDKELL